MIYAAVIRARNAACQIIDEAQIGDPSTDRLAIERVIERYSERSCHTHSRMREQHGPSTIITMEMKICKP